MADLKKNTWKYVARKYVPQITLWTALRHYNNRGLWKSKLVGDFSAGLLVAVVLVPQSLAYAQLAGLPAIYGLYSSIIALFIYPIFSTSPQLAIGPVTMVSLMLFGSLTSLFPSTQHDPVLLIEYAFLMTFAVGLVQLVMGLCRVGYYFENFLSQPVLGGFTLAAGKFDPLFYLVTEYDVLFGSYFDYL